jgi:RNA polymerase sigma factor (sigma-70 family)
MGEEAPSVLPLWYSRYHKYLLSVAYRMLGSFSEAEDAVQDVFVKLHGMNESDIREAKPFLTRMTVTRSLDILKSARRQREKYIGPWLPDPDVSPFPTDAGDRLIMEETVSYALLVVLEALTPGERAVFLLRETFGYEYAEVAAVLGKTEMACRQTMSRVRKKLSGRSPEDPPMEIGRSRELTERFLHAASSGNLESLLEWLREDAVCLTDGGGIVTAAVRPLVGAGRVAAFLQGLATKYRTQDTRFVPILINGELGIGVLEGGAWTTVFYMEWLEGKVRHLYAIRNPEKLAKLLNAQI